MKRYICLFLVLIFGIIIGFHIAIYLKRYDNSYKIEYAQVYYTDPTLDIYYNNDLINEPIVIMNNEYTKISITKYLAKDYWWEFGYELEIINKTNKVLTVTIDDVSIIDTQCKPLFHIDHIDAYNTAYFIMAWDNDTIERCHIPYIDNIKFMIRVFNNENWTGPALAGEKVLIKNN